ncbi:ATP-dependent helicase [Saccharopolyspora sp. NPDC050389]|uniref:ATP-dependent helicase n=1 Tax=Saccharopolyspora sp. NPDC050389 TaxID=3155516 RepID=UPI0033C93087
MIVSGLDSGTLTEEQQAVVDQPADALVSVVAGPGTGKTHTLVRRLDTLVEHGGLSSGEILVLTFSRAAVRELRHRLAHHGDAARHVRAQTFDSWALDLLTSIDGNDEWQARGFEARIEGAVEAIQNGRADEYCDELRHIAVDEVQDLVGVRRVMVESLLERFDCGFTVVGDPAQAIYGFQISDPAARAAETNRFFTRMREIFGEELRELALTKNFRVREDTATAALPFGSELRKGVNGHGRSLGNRLRVALHDTVPFGDLSDEYARMVLSQESLTTAILCRTNGQALLVAEDLHQAGVHHRLQRSARDKIVAGWIAGLFNVGSGSFLTRSGFDELVRTFPLDEDAEHGLLWTWLVRATSTGRGDNTVDLRRLRSAIESGRLPDELTDQRAASVVVSSYHRAKGLEFDQVIVADPGPNRDGFDMDHAEEARMLYVAMTRARDELAWIDTPGDVRIRKHKATDRWARFGWQPWQRIGLELGSGDVSKDEPPGAEDFGTLCAALQHYLATEVHPADEVVLERLYEESIGFQESPPYLVMHGDRPIATVSRQFRRDLYRFQRPAGRQRPLGWPRRIAGVRVDCVEAVAGSEAAAIEAGLGSHGVWLIPRLEGLSTFVHDEKTV